MEIIIITNNKAIIDKRMRKVADPWLKVIISILIMDNMPKTIAVPKTNKLSWITSKHRRINNKIKLLTIFHIKVPTSSSNSSYNSKIIITIRAITTDWAS